MTRHPVATTMRRFLLPLLALAAALALAAPAYAVDPLPLTRSTPADGMTVPPTPTGGISWGITAPGLPDDAQVRVTIREDRTLEPDGVTLAAQGRVDFFALVPEAAPGTYSGQSDPGPNAWSGIVGGYFWQVFATWTDANQVFHSAAGPIERLGIGTAAPPATTPSPGAPTPGAGGGAGAPRTTLAMSSLDATYYVRRLIRLHTKRATVGLRYGCKRLNSRSFRCRPTWRDSRNQYSATVTFTHSRKSGRTVSSASLSGRRASRSCVRTRSFSSCQRSFRWRSVIAGRPLGKR